MKAAHLQTGENAENRACEFLQTQGLTLVTRNFRCPQGEIDLIMQDGKTRVIIEVRYRKNDKFGGALESVTKAKQNKLIAATQVYLNSLQTQELLPIRFDVVGILGNGQLEWVKNAFEVLV